MTGFRLTFFLALASASAAFGQSAGMGAWALASAGSALDKADSYASAMLDSANLLPAPRGRQKRATLIYRCNGAGSFSIYITWPASLGKHLDLRVRFKVGDSKIDSSYWKNSADEHATFATTDGHLLERLETLLLQTATDDHAMMVARVEPGNRPPQEAEFDLAGAKAAATAANRACGIP